MTTWTKLTATLMSVLVIATTALAAEASMDHLVISVHPKILRPTTQPNRSGALTLKAIDAHGAEQLVPISEAAITVKTKVASGGGLPSGTSLSRTSPCKDLLLTRRRFR